MSRPAPFQVTAETLAPYEGFGLPVFTPPLSIEEATPALAGLVSLFRDTPPSDLASVHLVCIGMAFALPRSISYLTPSETLNIRPVPFSRDDLNHFLGAEGTSTDRAAAYSKLSLRISIKATEESLGTVDATAAYAGFAMLVWAMGNPVNPTRPQAMADKRPQALIGSFTIPDNLHYLFPEKSSGPSLRALAVVHTALSSYSEVRARITMYLIALRVKNGHYPRHVAVLMTLFTMMEYCMMTQYTSIEKCLQAHPEVATVPSLVPFVIHFCRDLVTFSQLSDYEQRYHRLLAPADRILFRSSNIRPLIAVSVHLVSRVEGTLSDYLGGGTDDYSGLIEEVESVLVARTSNLHLTQLGGMMGLVFPDPDSQLAAPKVVKPAPFPPTH